MAEQQTRVSAEEVMEVLTWACENGLQGSTEHPDGSYEEGVADCIRWMLGDIKTRPDEA